jgi:hypothetical protein
LMWRESQLSGSLFGLLAAETTYIISSHLSYAEPSFPDAMATNLYFMSQTNKWKPLESS